MFSQYSQSHVKCILVGNSFTISRLRSGCRGGCHVWPTIIISGVSPKKYFPISGIWKYFVKISSWRPFGPLDFVLRAFNIKQSDRVSHARWVSNAH